MTDHRDPAYQAGYNGAIADALSATEVAVQLGISRQRLAEVAKQVALPRSRKIGGVRVYWPADVDALANRERGPSRWDRGDE